MRTVISRFLLLLLFIYLLCSCSSGNKTKDNISRQLRTIQSVQADHTARISSLEDNIRNLYGRVEELQFLIDKKLGSNVEKLESKLTFLQRRIPPPAIVPVKELEEDEARARTFSPNVYRIFINTLIKIREGSFQEVTQQLITLLNESNDLLARPYILFWLGVAYDGLGDPARALKYYYQLTNEYPNHSRIPLALLRQASAFIRLNDLKAAKLTLLKIIKKYPKSTAAKIAKERLKDLK